jgi:NadR type nicotinamide-nucleotide adenylyltransferase
MRRVLITGPESTGKSELAIALAQHYGGITVPEYAREYVEKLDGPCSYSDVEHIARWQQESYNRSILPGTYVFFDTWLIITRVWFEVVFKRVPSWIDEQISQARFDLVLLCHTDLPWVPDGVRENGGDMREELQERYRALIRREGWNCSTVKGIGEERLKNAIRLIDNFMANDKS